MILGLEAWVAIGCVLMVFVGATVQGVLGIGMGMLTAPILTIVDPAFVPAAIVIAVIPLSGGVAWANREHVERRDVGFALVGRVPGNVLGTVAVAALSQRWLAGLVGFSVLTGVAASVLAIRFRTTPRAMVAAGFASGFAGTAVGIGGPPMALTYQHAEPATMRATISAFFAIGAVLSVATLAIGGQIGGRELRLALLLLPGVLAGLAVAPHVAKLLRAGAVRWLVLGLCAVSAVALLIDELV